MHCRPDPRRLFLQLQDGRDGDQPTRDLGKGESLRCRHHFVFSEKSHLEQFQLPVTAAGFGVVAFAGEQGFGDVAQEG